MNRQGFSEKLDLESSFLNWIAMLLSRRPSFLWLGDEWTDKEKKDPFINRSTEQNGMMSMQLKDENLGNDNAGALNNDKTKIYSVIEAGKLIRSLNKSKMHLIFIPVLKTKYLKIKKLQYIKYV